jgi:hypothetical protein
MPRFYRQLICVIITEAHIGAWSGTWKQRMPSASLTTSLIVSVRCFSLRHYALSSGSR